ncbi:MAG: Tm-1-like ATP-binding domain-containing protein, partial [candidate division WOR-3 bacterium]
DILGLNDIIKVIFDNAVVALVNMVKSRDVYVDYEFKNKNLISVTMYGNTTPGVMIAKELLEERGYQVVVFHPNGTGGRAMEEMIYEGLFKGVLDYTPHEVVDYLLNGLHSAGPERLDAAIKTGVPLVLVPGCCDFILKGPLNTLPKKYRKRLIYGFNPLYTLVKVSIEEAKMIGRYIANKLNNAKEKSKIAVVFPLKGISMYDKEGDLFFDPEVDKAIFNSIKKNISPEIRIVEVDAHINEWPVPKTCVEILLELIEKENL